MFRYVVRIEWGFKLAIVDFCLIRTIWSHCTHHIISSGLHHCWSWSFRSQCFFYASVGSGGLQMMLLQSCTMMQTGCNDAMKVHKQAHSSVNCAMNESFWGRSLQTLSAWLCVFFLHGEHVKLSVLDAAWCLVTMIDRLLQNHPNPWAPVSPWQNAETWAFLVQVQEIWLLVGVFELLCGSYPLAKSRLMRGVGCRSHIARRFVQFLSSMSDFSSSNAVLEFLRNHNFVHATLAASVYNSSFLACGHIDLS